MCGALEPSPDSSGRDEELDDAIIDALDAHALTSTKAHNSPEVKRGIMKVLLEHSGL